MGRRMFRTKSGYLGMAGPRVLPGDVVTVVRGSKAPVVMRRKGGDASGTWELVGDAYVHGIMRGEAVDRTAKTAATGGEIWTEVAVE
jgi:hypothetical protein